MGTGQFPRRKNKFLSAENAGRSLLGNMSSTGMFRSLVSTAVSAGSTVGLMQMLGDLAVASDEQHENAVRSFDQRTILHWLTSHWQSLMFRGMQEIYCRM